MDVDTGIWNGLLAGAAVIAAVVVLTLVGFGVLPAAAVLPVVAGAVWCLWKGLREYTPAQFDHWEIDGGGAMRWVDR
ncbi:MAG: hypothetical protein INR72_15560 [Williamsia herbipolensis]|nr:hypothetical protein [Williamsia herbipolensis]